MRHDERTQAARYFAALTQKPSRESVGQRLAQQAKARRRAGWLARLERAR